MSILGPLAKGLAALTGKQPEEQLQPRGFLGLEWSEQVVSGHKQVVVQGVLEGLPAAQGGIQRGDQIMKIGDLEIKSLKDARIALSKVYPSSLVSFIVRRGSGISSHELSLMLTAAEGL